MTMIVTQAQASRQRAGENCEMACRDRHWRQMSALRYPSSVIRVAESRFLWSIIRVALSASHYLSRVIPVEFFKSLYLSREIRVALFKSHCLPCLLVAAAWRHSVQAAGEFQAVS